MACMLYRNGDKNIVFGRPCEYRIFDDEAVDNALMNGWYDHPNRLPDDNIINGEFVAESDIIEADFEEIDTNNSGKLSNKEVRAAAEKAGIESFDKKMIKTLKKELGV